MNLFCFASKIGRCTCKHPKPYKEQYENITVVLVCQISFLCFFVGRVSLLFYENFPKNFQPRMERPHSRPIINQSISQRFRSLLAAIRHRGEQYLDVSLYAVYGCRHWSQLRGRAVPRYGFLPSAGGASITITD